MLLLLVACTDQTVLWDDILPNDVVSDTIAEVLAGGRVERQDDADLVSAAHAAGTTMTMDVKRADGGSVTGWTVESLSPEICDLSIRLGSSAVRAEMWFLQPGSTALYVLDEDAIVMDWQPIEVRAPAGAVLYREDTLAVGWTEPVTQLDVLPGSHGGVPLTWADAEARPLSGVGLLQTSSDNEDIFAPVRIPLDGGTYESFGLQVAETATEGGTVTVSAGEVAVAALPIVLHAPEEVDRVSIEGDVGVVSDDDTSTRGWLRARTYAAEVDLFGVDVTWSVDGQGLGEDNWVRVAGGGPDDLHDISACYGDLCDTVQVAGVIVSLSDMEPTWDCGCQQAPTPGFAGLVGLFALLRRRRSPR